MKITEKLNQKQTILAILVIIMALILLIILLLDLSKKDQIGASSKITTAKINVSTSINNSDEKIVWSELPITTISLENKREITEPGTYILTGSLTDNYLKVNTLGDVKLIFSGINISNNFGPAIYIENANHTVIELSAETISRLSDGKIYQDLPSDINATIYSEDDLVIQGTGTLEITANKEDAIVSKNNLKIISGTYNITSIDDGLRGKDSTYIKNGSFNIDSGGDSIKSSRGFIAIDNGTFNLTTSKDGIQSSKDLLIKNGTFNITSKNDSLLDYSMEQPSTKGIKATGNILIRNALMNIKTLDDALHSDKSIAITKGTYSFLSLDDAINAKDKLIIDGGNIDIPKSVKGLKANYIIINNGTLNITATDQEISKKAKLYIYGGTTSLSTLETKTTLADYKGFFNINKGTLIISSNEELISSLRTTSNIKVLAISFDKEYQEGATITLLKGEEVILTYHSRKNFRNLLIASSTLTEKDNYQLKINNKLYKNTKLSSHVTTIK